MKHFRHATPLVILFAALGGASIAQASINFSSFTGQAPFPGGTVDGYTITSSADGFVWAPGYTGFATNGVGDLEQFEAVNFTFTDGGTFTFVSLDIANILGGSDPDVTVTGYLSAALLGTDTFTPPTASHTPETFDAVNLAGIPIDTLVITVSSNDVQTPVVDNIAFSSASVPEPASIGMLGLGLCGVLAFRSKRKNTV